MTFSANVIVVVIILLGGGAILVAKTGRSRVSVCIAGTILLVVLGLISLSMALDYVDRMFYAVPHSGDRTAVATVLRHFRETKVSLADVREDFRSGSSDTSHTVYRYDFLGWSALSIHVIYDSEGKVSAIVPTYE